MRKGLGIVAPLALLVALLAYFGLHAVSGNNGLQRRATLEHHIHALEAELATLRAARQRLETGVRLLTTDVAKHPELLEEEARRQLGYARAGDIVIVPRNAP